ncbi:MAG TPA: hypothetical protein VFZ03_14770 [Dongiaceae bacterium]
MRYTPQFVALLGSEGAATGAARIKSPAFAATLSNGREANGYRAVALGTVLACILVAGSATAVWQFSDNSVRRAPEFAGTLVVAEPSNVAAPSAGAMVFDIQAGVSDPAGQDPSGHLSASPIDVPLPRGALQAAVDSAPFRPPVLGIATAGLPVGANALGIAKEVGFAASDPSSNAALEANGADGSFTPPSNASDFGGRPPLSSGEQGGTLPSDGSPADDSLGNGGHRESDRPNYVARFAREALRTSAAIATVAGRLRPGTAGTPEADSEFDAHSDGAASAEQASAKHRSPEPAGGREIVDGSSKADITPSRGAGSQASPGSDDAGRSADGAPNGRGKDAGGSANSGGGSADGNSGLGSGSADAAGSDAAADTSSRNGRGQTQRGKNDNGGSADAPGRQGNEKDADAGSAGQNGGSAQSDTGRGDQEGGDDGGGKEHGGKGHGGKDHGGKDHGDKGDR